jgi:PAS domain-containing protein
MYPVPTDETERLQALDTYRLRDIAREAAFDELAALAADMAGVPIASVSIIDKDEQCLAGTWGGKAERTSRGDAFCSYTILSDELLVVRDATTDPRFCKNPFVTGEPHIRFYAGAPIHAGGRRVGSLCVVGFEARDFGMEDERRLRALARVASRMIESRLGALLKSDSESRLDSMIESMPVAISIYDRDERFLRANTRYLQTFLPHAQDPPKVGSTFAEVLDAVEAQGVRMSVDGDTSDWKRRRLELRQRNAGFYEMRLSTGIWLACREVRTGDGSLLATFTDITQLKEREAALALHTGVLRSTLDPWGAATVAGTRSPPPTGAASTSTAPWRRTGGSSSPAATSRRAGKSIASRTNSSPP